MCNNCFIFAFAIATHLLFFVDDVYAFEGCRVNVEPAVLEIPAGGEGIAAIKITIPKGYHIYGNPVGPGTGKPTTISVRNLPAGIEIGSVRYYPEAKKYFEPGDKGHVWIYEGEVFFFLPVKVKKEAKIGEAAFDMSVDALVCGEGSCMPVEKIIHKKIAILPFDGTAPSLPPEILTLYRSAKASTSDGKNSEGSVSSSTREITIPYSFQPRYVDTISVGNIIHAIVFGILAGFILNFMPCVLPVVSLKVMSFVSLGGEDRKKIFLSGVFFSLGIMAVFLALAAIAAFFGYGWGELFKKKEFLMVMTTLVFAFALSMFDVYTITPSVSSTNVWNKTKNIFLDSFGKGVLATFLATPCSGPFLGGTLAWTMMQPPLVIFTIFVCIGTGMALPYLILAAWPSLMRFIPKPGEWTIIFERIMGLLLLATAIYLLGIMETRDIIPMLWFLLFVLVACGQYGKFGSPLNAKIIRYVSLAVAAVIVLTGYVVAFKIPWSTSIDDYEATSRQFTLEKIVQNSELGKISIVQFTADWCPNCRLVERTSLYTKKVMEVLQESDAELLMADITRGNPEAEALMAKLGSRSIPFLAIFPPGEHFTRPICLRDMYSQKSVIFAVKQAMESELEVKIEHLNLEK